MLRIRGIYNTNQKNCLNELFEHLENQYDQVGIDLNFCLDDNQLRIGLSPFTYEAYNNVLEWLNSPDSGWHLAEEQYEDQQEYKSYYYKNCITTIRLYTDTEEIEQWKKYLINLQV